MSLVLSIVATGMYLSFDMARRVKFGNMSASAVRSMSVVLVFIILQTSVCCWAIAKELSFWNDYFDKVHEELDHPFISDIQTRGNRIRLIFTGILGIVFIILVLAEALYVFCWKDGKGKSSASFKGSLGSVNKSSTDSSPKSASTMDLEASFSIDSKTEGVNEITTTTKEENADASPDVPSWAIVD